MIALHFAFLGVHFSAGVKVMQAVTPVEKVTKLLKQLSEQVTKEGKDEATAYDKYACFCKEQADNKLYQIETSKEKIEAMSAKIEDLTGEIESLDADVQKLDEKIKGLEEDIQSATDARNKEHEAYAVDEADMSEAIDQIKRAIEALKSSKGDMGGKANREALAQVRSIVSRATTVAGSELAANLHLMSAEPGTSYTSEYHSNDIIATLEELLQLFTKKKNELDQAEFEANSDFEKKRLAMQNQQKFATKDMEEKKALSQAKDEERSDTEAAKLQETKDKDADQSFLDVVTSDCETKAQLWDQRSKTRAAELTAISEAISFLETGVSPNYAANKKLVELQKDSGARAHIAKKGALAEKDARLPVSLVQLGGVGSVGSPHTVVPRAVALLASAAERLGSSQLASAVLKARTSDDHFVKVRGLIKDLIERLETQKAAENDQKSFCDKEMEAAMTQRDEKQAKKEELDAEITVKTSKKQSLQEEIAELSKAIAANMKALNEATELRADEKAENKKTIEEATEGKGAVEGALNVLKQFYEANAEFLQRGSKYVPPDSDREGKTVGDLAPKVFESEYKGKQDDSKGVLGLLEVILSDFERTIDTVTKEEETAEADFENFKEANEADTKEKTSGKEEKETSVSDIEDELLELADDLKDAKEQYDLALKELKGLQKQCVEGEETYAERVEKRNKEIEACKQALAILESWQS